ncbi:hypothetical protein [uncultured Acidaminococcus sp.]|uniref:hypothetical protein n=1 Tax=uncultured Acidaminococcus sp. TaxID=352152 RepID=UPI00261B4F36|nr:hypothetical protein [uncultured Acidaminococcus sp.]
MDKMRRENMILSDEIRRRQNEFKEEGIQEGWKQRQRQLLLNFLSSGMVCGTGGYGSQGFYGICAEAD